MVWPHDKILWHGEDNSAGNNERSKKERKTEEEMGRYHQGMDGNGVWRFPEGNGRQERVERNCCNVICAAPTTSKVKGLRDERNVFNGLLAYTPKSKFNPEPSAPRNSFQKC